MKYFFKKIYSALPFKKQIFLVLRLFSLPEGIFKHLYFEGLISVLIGKSVFKIYHYGYQLENELFWKGIEGGWEKVSMQIWLALSR